jgi:hypothetical protein
LETVLSVCLGLGLAAACGFRVFVPCLLVGVLKRAGADTLEVMPQWMASTGALTALGAATLVEVAAYYLPWLDNLLDTVTTPLSVVAGILLFVAANDALPPFWRWGLGIVAGGGAAGIAQGATVMTRMLSTATTGGLGNFLVATAEWLGSALIVVAVVLLAPLAVVLLLLLLLGLFRGNRRRKVAA